MATSILTGIVTNIGREVFAKDFGNQLGGFGTANARAYKFKFGEGGFIDTGSGRVPKDPADGATLTDVEAAGDPSLFSFEKLFVSTDYTFIQTTPDSNIMQLRCRLVELEANDNGFGDSPRFFEIGIFDDDDNMLIYTTFSEQTKTASKILTNFIQVLF